MNRNFTQVLITSAVVIFGFAAVFLLSGYIESNRLSLPESYEDEDLAVQGKRLKGYALGMEGLLADWYWMRSLQYIGDKVMRNSDALTMDDMSPLNPRLLYPLLDNATELDPHFMPAYSYGATVLPAIDKQQAIALTEKGIANNPEQWRLFQYLGYIYWREKDYEKAAETYKAGAAIPGAPSFFGLMAARMNTEGGSRETAYEMYAQMFEGAQDEQTKTTARLRLFEIDSLYERDAINSVLAAYRERTGACPQSFAPVLPELARVELPRGRDFSVDKDRNLVDPSGVPYYFEKNSCKVFIDRRTSKIPAH